MSKTIELSKIENGKTYKIGDTEFVKFFDENGETVAMVKDCLFRSTFGKNNDLRESEILEKLNTEFLPKIAEIIGEENICEFETDLTTLDGLKTYGSMKSKVSLPTLDFYRANVEIFDKYKIDCSFWLATPESTNPHNNPYWLLCVSPGGGIDCGLYYYGNGGVRPFLHFVSSISVSCDE